MELSDAMADSPPLFLFFSFFLLLTAPLLLLLISASRRSAAKKPSFSSPPALPLIGNLHQLTRLPHVSLAALAARYGGDLLLLRLGAVPTLVVSSPAAAEQVLRAHDIAFASRPESPHVSTVYYGGRNVAFAPHGERWRLGRKLCNLHLLTPKKVQSFSSARQEEVSLAVAAVLGAAESGDSVDMSKLLHQFASSTICRAVSGRMYKKEGRDLLFRDLIATNARIIGGFGIRDHFPWLSQALGMDKLAVEVNRRWDELLEQVICEHEDGLSGDNSGDLDFVDVLLSVQEEYRLERDQVKAILQDMFAAGTNTTYLVLEWAMAELMNHPEAMEKLRKELRAGGGELYLKAVLKETLRLHPPLPLLIPHASTEDCEVLGHRVPKGMRVVINAWAIARDRRQWGEAAEEFRPERFEGGDDVEYQPGKETHFIPFGAGRRMCPGIGFGMAGVELMLANLVRRFDWELPPELERVDMTEKFGLSLRRAHSLILFPRLP